MHQPAATPRTQAEEFLTREMATLVIYEQARQSFSHVSGWLHPAEGFLLMRLASATNAMPAGAVVEIGSFKGLSTCWLASGLRSVRSRTGADAGKVFAIDHFTGSPEHQAGGKFEDAEIVKHGSTLPLFRENIQKAGLTDLVEVVQAGSLEAVKTWSGAPIRLLFIDGDHSYEATRDDFAAWSKFVPVGGYTCFHDVNTWEGVTRFVKELMADPSRRFITVMGAASLLVARRIA